MNTGLQSQIRAYGNQLVDDQPPITNADITAFLDTIQQLPAPSVPVQKRPGLWVAVAAAAVVLILVGALPLLFTTSEKDTPPATEPSSTVTTIGPEAATVELPNVALGDVPAFEATVRYTYSDSGGSAYDDGAVVDVRVSYLPPMSFRRDVIAYEPEVMEIRFGQVGSHVAVNETFPDLAYETFEEGEALGPLVWSNWQDACAHPPVAAATEDTGSTLLTVVECDTADSPWVTPGTPWRVKVDAATGIVFDVEADLRDGGQFKIPARRVEILSINYTPQSTEDFFANPNPPKPPEFPAEPIAYSVRFPDGTEVAISMWSTETSRADVIVADSLAVGDLVLGLGSYLIETGGIEYTYNADTNQYSTDIRTILGWRDWLVEWTCDGSGTCRRWEWDEPDGPESACQMSDGGTIVGRPVAKYDCQPTNGSEELTLWIDNELGYVLKAVDRSFISYEVTAIDLHPTYPQGHFEQKCPTPDCTPVPTE